MEVLGDRLKKEPPLRGRGARFFDRSFCVREKSAFTLIEVLVVVAVSAVIATGGFVMFSGYQKNQNIKLTLSELAATIRDIQKRSVTQENGKQWGIRLSNGVSDSFQTWSGLSYASGTPDQTYSLKRNIQFGNPPSGFTTDLIFQAMTGILGGDRIVTVNSGAGALVGDVIINTRGKVTTRVEKGLVGYWHFDEGTSTVAYDASGNANNGTLTNGPTWQSGVNCKAGECLNFNGTNNYLEGGMRDIWKFGTGNFSVGMWVYPTSFNSEASLYDALILNGVGGRIDAFVMVQNATTGKLRLFTNGVYTSASTGNLTLNAWNYVGLVRSGTTATFYINGVADVTTVTLSTNITSGGVILGRYSDVASGYFTGRIDEVRIYNRALSAQEVLDIYNDLK